MEEKFLDIGLGIAFQLFGHIGYAASGNVFAESHSCIALEGIVYVGAVREDLLRQGRQVHVWVAPPLVVIYYH